MMQKFIEEFKNIRSENDLRDFVQRNALKLADSRSHPDQYVLGIFIGKLSGGNLKLIHRLMERDMQTYLDKHRNQLTLECEGHAPIEVFFKGNY
jgi:hypothetical protein